MAFIVDPGASADAGLLQFLNTFKTRTEVFAHHDAADFVNTLHTKWLELNPAAPPADAMPLGAVFVSYASEDRPRVEPIVQALRARDLPVWFDRQQLEPGDGWDAKIRRNLDQASAFIPILSDTAVRQTERYFFAEWNQSVERSHRIARGTRFIFPIAIDAVDPTNPAIPDEFRAAQFTSLAAGDIPVALIEGLKAAVKHETGHAAMSVARPTVRATSKLDYDNPWPGLAAFERTRRSFTAATRQSMRCST